MSMTPPTCIGIDPGRHGGIAVIRGDEVLRLLSMPYDEVLDEFDAQGIAGAVVGYAGHCFCAIEKQHPRPHTTKDGRRIIPTSDGELMRGYGYVLAVLHMSGVYPALVHPKTWQEAMMRGLPQVKGEYRGITMAKKLFPSVADQLYTKRGKELDGKADALLIARWVQSRIKCGMVGPA